LGKRCKAFGGSVGWVGEKGDGNDRARVGARLGKVFETQPAMWKIETSKLGRTIVKP